jgi:hypothetical protein
LPDDAVPRHREQSAIVTNANFGGRYDNYNNMDGLMAAPEFSTMSINAKSGYKRAKIDTFSGYEKIRIPVSSGNSV